MRPNPSTPSPAETDRYAPAIPSRRHARRRAWSCAAAIALGVLAARLVIDANLAPPGFHLSPIALALAGLLGGAVLVVPRGVGSAGGLAACALIGFGVAHARLAEPPPDHLSRLVAGVGPADTPPLVRLRGTVLETPTRETPEPGTLDEALRRFGPPTDAFPLKIDAIVRTGEDGTPIAAHASGEVRVYASDLGEGAVRAGDRIEALGFLSPVRPPMNPGQADPRLWGAQSGRAGSLRTSGDAIERIDHRGSWSAFEGNLRRAVASLRARAVALVDSEDGEQAAGGRAVRAMLLGERTGRDDAAYARTGTAHLLAISGFHLSVLAMITVGIVRATGDRPIAESLVGLAFLGAYLLLVPAHTPIVRAALLFALVLVARLFARRWDTLTLLGWITAALILARPLDLTTLGFQLTVGITTLLIWMSAERHPWTAGRSARFRLEAQLGREVTPWARAVEAVRTAAVTAVLVWFVSAPVIVYHTGWFNPLTPIAVVVSTPIAAGLQVLGFAGLAVSMVSEPIGGSLIDAAFAAGRALGWVTGLFDSARAGWVAPPVSAAWAVAAIGAGLFVIVRARLRDWRPWAAVVLVLIWFGVEVRRSGSLEPSVAARVDMLAVGDGSCLLVRAAASGGAAAGDDDAFLWDAGSLRAGLGVRTIPSSLRALGSPRVRTALLTHANIDHYSALPDVARPIGLERVLVSEPALASMRSAPEGSAPRLFLAQMESLGVAVEPIARGGELAVGGATLRVLWPPADPPVSIRAANDRSLVARVSVSTDAGERRALLVGDIQRSAMLMLLADDEPDTDTGLLDAEVAELAHHGSHHAVAEAFLSAVGPGVVLQSTGPSRVSDRRWNETKRELGAWWGITARDGSVRGVIFRDGSVGWGSVRGE